MNHARLLCLSLLLPACNSTTPVAPLQIPSATPLGAPTATLAPSPTREPELHPSARSGHELVYHAQLQMILLVGGGYTGPDERVETHANLWGWDGERWRIINANGPERRGLGGVAYDSRRNVLVIYGGYTREECYTDTWEWDGETWSEKTVTGPGVCDHFSMTYDAARGRIVLFGGQDATQTGMCQPFETTGLRI